MTSGVSRIVQTTWWWHRPVQTQTSTSPMRWTCPCLHMLLLGRRAAFGLCFSTVEPSSHLPAGWIDIWQERTRTDTGGRGCMRASLAFVHTPGQVMVFGDEILREKVGQVLAALEMETEECGRKVPHPRQWLGSYYRKVILAHK